MKKQELIERLKPFAQSCFSGHIEEWPQLKPLLKDIYKYLMNESNRPCPSCFFAYEDGFNRCDVCGFVLMANTTYKE